jgi:ABC-type branched-subunit amino acid transport system ATPase component
MYRADIDGAPVEMGSMHAAARLGIVRTFQTLKLSGEMTVIEHVLIGLSRHSRATVWDAMIRSRRGREEALRQVRESRDLLGVLGIAHLKNTPANALAYGHGWFVELARALAVRPRVLLLDEPSLGLAPIIVRSIFDTFAKLRSRGLTILIVGQMAWPGLEICDHAHVLKTGRIAISGTAQELATNPRVMEAYQGSRA